MRFDLTSFLIGFFVAGALAAALYGFRKQIGTVRDRIRDAIGKAGERLTSRTDERYRQDVQRLWQTAHLAGSVLALDEIFVEPRFWMEPPPAEPDKDFEPDITHVVPATLDYPELAALYQAPGYTLRDIARAPHNILIIGKPGAGKSVALTKIGLRAAALDADFFPNPTLPLKVHAADLDLPLTPKADVAQPLIDAVGERVSAITAAALPEYLPSILKRGGALILLDGLDDLPRPHLALVADWIKTFTAAYAGNRIIATGPNTGFAPLLALGFVPVVIGGWSNEDVRALVNCWVAAWSNVLAVQKRKRKAGEEVDPALVAGWLTGGTVARTPLEVTLKIWTGLAGDAEGPRVVDWIEAYLKRLSGRAPEARLALQHAAGDMLAQERCGLVRERFTAAISMSRAETSNPSTMDPQDVVDELAGKGGLLVRRAAWRYSISHPIIAAYLAAKAVALGASPDDSINAVHQLPVWSLALRFYAALGNAASIAAPRLAAPPDAVQSDLFTVANWLGDAAPKAAWKADVFRRLAQLFVDSQMPIHLRSRAACALVASRDETVSKLFKQCLASPDPLTRQYAAAALGALNDSAAVPELNKLVSDNDLYVRWAAVLALALIGDQASTDALAHALVEGDEGLRRAVCEALALNPTGGHKMLRDAIVDTDVVVRRGAVSGLQKVGAQLWVFELLDKAFMDDSQWIVRSAAEVAARELRTPPDRFPQPITPPDRTPWLVTFAAGKGVNVLPDANDHSALVKALREGDEPVKIAAADHLGRLAALDALPTLRAAARDGFPALREMAYQALANIAFATGERVTL